MAITINGDGTVTGLIKGGIPNTALSTGTVIQTVSDVLDTAYSQTTSGTTTYTVTGLAATITLGNSANKVLIQVSLKTAYADMHNQMGWWLNRNTSSSDNALARGAADGNRTRVSGSSGAYNETTKHIDSESLTFLDTPGATGPHTYNIQFNDPGGNGGTFCVNRPRNDADDNSYVRGISTITLTEIVG
tara:strand:+ start:395 stop:961 length:567 start_codon:yes stop_codon:yes gene_type:complete